MKPLDPRLLREAEAAKWFIASLVALAVISVVCTIAFAWFLTRFVTGIFGQELSFGEALPLLGVVALAGSIKAAAIGIQETLAVKASSKVKTQLRRKLLQTVSNQALLKQYSSTEFSNLFTRGLDSLDSYFSKYLPQLVVAVIATSILGIVITVSDFTSGIILAATLPLIPLFMVLIGLATRAAQRSQFEALTKLSQHFSQILRGLTTLRVFDRSAAVLESVKQTGEQYRRRTMKVLRYSFLSGFALELGASLAVALVAVSIGFRLMAGEMSLFTGLFVLLLAPEAFLPLRQLGIQYHAATEGIESTSKAIEMLDAKGLVTHASTEGAGSRTSSHQEKSFQEIAQRLGQARGCFLSVSGKSGVGKSTMLKRLIAELAPANLVYSPQRIQIVGSDVRAAIIGPKDAQRNYVDQFRLDRAIALASLDDISLSSPVGELQKVLSGGQQQRIVLARALYFVLGMPGSILLLDEPLSFVDSVRGSQIVSNLQQLASEGYRILVVSHQEYVTKASDESWVL